jgi:hypothetical protein
MIQSINSDLYSELKVSSVSASPAAKTSSSDSELTVSSQTPKTDTIEISEQARQAMQQSKVAAANTEQSVQADAAQQKAAAVAESSAKASAANAKAAPQSGKSNAAVRNSMSSSADAETTGSTTESPVLSALTESQLDKLVKSGTITTTQKNAELARRAAAAAQQTAADDSNKKAISKAQEQGIESYKQQAAYGVGAITESGMLLNSVA